MADVLSVVSARRREAKTRALFEFPEGFPSDDLTSPPGTTFRASDCTLE
jgi:hypothetical protein